MEGKRWLLLSLAFVVFVGLPVGSVWKAASAAEQNSPAQASTAIKPEGSITGTVKDPSGAALLGAKITLRADEAAVDPAAVVAVTDDKGNFAFGAVAPGTYTIEVQSAGFPTSFRSHVVVGSLAHVVADFSLRPPASAGISPASVSARSDEKRDGKAGGRPALPAALDGFNYDDRADFKPDSVNVAGEPAGYSAGKQVDSYRLMLDYVISEGTGSLSAHGPASVSAANAGVGAKSAPDSTPVTAAELSTWNESQFLSHGSNLLLRRDVAASIDTLQSGVMRFPNSAQLQTGLGIALSARGEYARSIACLLRATDLAPSDPKPYFVLAQAYNGYPGRDDEVLKRLRRLVGIDPKNPQAPYYDALALMKGGSGGLDDATGKQVESLLKQALALDANFADAHLQLGNLYAARSDYSRAIPEYQAAVRLKPSLAAAHYRLAQAYNRTGDKAAAQSELGIFENLRQAEPSRPSPK